MATVKLGSVTAGSELEQRILHRDSPLEVSRYETLWWTEDPDVYVRRSLARALFDARPLQEGLTGTPPTLEVEVLDFEEVRYADQRFGRVRLRYRLLGSQVVLAHGEVTAERPVRGPDFEATARAVGEAMEQATAQIADAVLGAVAPTPPSAQLTGAGV